MKELQNKDKSYVRKFFLTVPNISINMMSLMAKLYMGLYGLFHFSHGPSSSWLWNRLAIRRARTTNENLHFFGGGGARAPLKSLFYWRVLPSGHPLLKWKQPFLLIWRNQNIAEKPDFYKFIQNLTQKITTINMQVNRRLFLGIKRHH